MSEMLQFLELLHRPEKFGKSHILLLHYGQPIDCADRNSSNATKIYLDISTRFLKCFFAKSVLSHNSDTYLDVMRCHQLLEGVSLVNHQSRNIDSRFRNDFGAAKRDANCS